MPQVWADTDLLERVMQNLLDNAIKFTPIGGNISLSAEPKPEEARLLISIRDTGAGIPEGVRLFQKFGKGDQDEKGSGLGLAFCRMALEAHQESIWVAESSAAGTTITFSLATQPAEETQADTPEL